MIFPRKTIVLIAVLLICINLNSLRAEEMNVPQLIPKLSTWKYLVATSYPDVKWMSPAFDDSSWPEGQGILGYGEPYVNTVIGYGGNASNKNITTLLRISFQADSASLVMRNLSLLANFDDGFVAYLNGQEVLRRSLPLGDIQFGTTASSHEAGSYDMIDITPFKSNLVLGTNVLAVEVHQKSRTSSDLIWDGSLGSASSDGILIWSGGVTTGSARVKARLPFDSSIARLAVSSQQDMSFPLYSTFDTAVTSENDRVLSFSIDGLQSDQTYYYAVEVDGLLETEKVGKFHTFPADSGSFMFALGSCNWTGSSHPVFDTIRLREPLFFLHMGDMHYQNIGVNKRELFRDTFRRTLRSTSQSRLYLNVPIAYIWDDHDYGPNNSDSTAPGRQAARLTYREYVPHYPLVETDPEGAIYQAFSVGRVRFIVCDSRSARSPHTAPDNPEKTMLGETQKAWFKSELLAAKDKYSLIVWVNSLPWIGLTGDDGWYEYTYERRELANFIADNGIDNLCMVSGDAHMVAIDDGSNSDYSDSGGAAFPVFHSASLDRTPSPKGGPYSHGMFPGVGQYGLFTVTDGPDSIRVHWSGRHFQTGELTSLSFAYPIKIVTDIEDGSDSESSILKPESVTLSQNYPNPFNAGTIIEYYISKRNQVELTIFGPTGRLVRTLVDKVQPHGTRRASWDGKDTSGKAVASGVYLYRLTVGDESFSRKMILLK